MAGGFQFLKDLDLFKPGGCKVWAGSGSRPLAFFRRAFSNDLDLSRSSGSIVWVGSGSPPSFLQKERLQSLNQASWAGSGSKPQVFFRLSFACTLQSLNDLFLCRPNQAQGLGLGLGLA